MRKQWRAHCTLWSMRVGVAFLTSVCFFYYYFFFFFCSSFFFFLPQLHIQSLNQLQQTSDAIARGLDHLSELGVELLEAMPPDLEAWCYSLDPEDEQSFQDHPVLHQPPMTDQLDLVRMHVLGALVRRHRKTNEQRMASGLVWPCS